MSPRYWLPRRSWWLEHNQCRSLSFLPGCFVALFASYSESKALRRSAPISLLSYSRFSTRTCEYAFEILPDWPILFGFDRFAQASGQKSCPVKLELRWESALNCRILVMLVCLGKLLPASSMHSTTNQDSGGCPSPDQSQVKIGR